MGISINGPSGIDTAYIIDSLTSLEQQKVTDVTAQEDVYKAKIDAYTKLGSYLSEIGSVAKDLQDESDFNVYNITSSNEDIVKFEATGGGISGSYDINIFQTAQHEKMISNAGLVTDQTAALSSYGITSGSFSINGTTITLDDTDTIQDLRSKINSATDANGDPIGVTSTVLKVSETDYRLVLTASDTGSSGASYQDLPGGTVLQSLGIITDASGNKDIATESIKSDLDINSAFSGALVGDVIQYAGLDRDGNSVSSTFVKTSSSTIDDLIQHISDTFHGTADVMLNGDGTVSITDKTGGTSSLSISSFDIGGTNYNFTTTQTGYKGNNVLSLGKDAFFSVDHINMSSTTNTASGYITGVDLTLKKASSETVVIDVAKDYDTITSKVSKLINTYNAFSKFVTDATKFKDQNAGENGGVLSGDMTARSILNQIKSEFQKRLDITGDRSINSLSMVGLSTDTSTGNYKLDESAFKKALRNNFDDVVSMFVTKGYSTDNSNLTLGRYGDDTEEGIYTLTEPDANHYDILQTGDSSTYTSGFRIGDVIRFDSGPASGLSLTLPSGSGSATFVFSKGLSGHISDLVSKLTDPLDGIVTERKKSWNNTIDSLEDRAIRLQDRVDSYHDRLVKQFAAMEQSMMQLKSQSSNMLSQLGMYSANNNSK